MLHVSAVEELKETPRPLDLRSFPCLDNLLFYLEPLAQPHDSMLAALQETLVLWVTRETLVLWVTPDACEQLKDRPPSGPQLYLRPRRALFRREEYVGLLRVIGPVVEAALCSQAPSADDVQALHNAVEGEEEAEGNPCRADVVIQDLADRLEWADWWRTHIHECFPTFAKWKRLEVDPSHDGECPSSHPSTSPAQRGLRSGRRSYRAQ